MTQGKDTSVQNNLGNRGSILTRRRHNDTESALSINSNRSHQIVQEKDTPVQNSPSNRGSNSTRGRDEESVMSFSTEQGNEREQRGDWNRVHGMVQGTEGSAHETVVDEDCNLTYTSDSTSPVADTSFGSVEEVDDDDDDSLTVIEVHSAPHPGRNNPTSSTGNLAPLHYEQPLEGRTAPRHVTSRVPNEETPSHEATISRKNKNNVSRSTAQHNRTRATAQHNPLGRGSSATTAKSVYNCTHCEKTFKTKLGLKSHTQHHTGMLLYLSRVATAQGKQGILLSNFPDMKHAEFKEVNKNTGNLDKAGKINKF